MSILQLDYSHPIKIRSIISYPREAQVGKTYLMSIDVQLASPQDAWTYKEEEYPITFMLDTLPYFSFEPIGEHKSTVILHRFGGTYGPIEYLLTAASKEVSRGSIGITFLNGWGIPIYHREMECEIKREIVGASQVEAYPPLEIQSLEENSKQQESHRMDLLMIGAGYVGWWTANMLAQRGISTTIIDTHPVAAYSSTRNQGWLHSGAYYAIRGDNDPSTRNQGWLHSGAYYAIRGDTETFQACESGFQFIEHYFPQAILKNIPCYYLFRTPEECERAINRCQQANIFAHPFDFKQLLEQEPILASTRFVYPLEVLDRPIDNTMLMQQVVQQACDNGARFQAVKTLDSIKPEWDAGKKVWQVSLDEKTSVECKVIVVACGTYIPAMLKRLLPSEVPAFTIMKTPVLVLRGDIAHSMLITPEVFQGPNLVPFSDRNGEGVAITLQHLEERIADHTDFTVPTDCMQIFKESLLDTFGGLQTLVKQQQFIPAYFYTSQKLFLGDFDDTGVLAASRSGFLLTHASEPGALENILTVYPGKLTTAPIIAQQCIERLLPMLARPKRSSRPLLKQSAPAVAQQPLSADPTYKLTVDDEQLDFIPWNKESM